MCCDSHSIVCRLHQEAKTGFERLSGAVSSACGPGDTEHPQFSRWNTMVLIAFMRAQSPAAESPWPLIVESSTEIEWGQEPRNVLSQASLPCPSSVGELCPL